MAVIDVGVDLGSTQLRCAYAAYGDQPSVVTVSGADWPWLLCEPAAGSTVPVSFPSLKSKLGTESTDAGVAPADLVTKALDVVRTGILRESGTGIGQTVISVPTRFPTIARTALLAAAADAGLTDVSLITDSVATVINQATDVHTGTYLVYGMGYRGYELGLVRAVRGTYRVLGYEGAAVPGGATLDALVLGSWLAALRQHGALPKGTYRGAADWPRLRQLAEQVKLRLAAGQSVLFPQSVPAPGGELHVKFEQSSFHRQVQAMLSGPLDRIAALLKRTELNPSAVDFITLSGGSTTMPALREAVGRLGRPVAVAEDNHIAIGALRHAHQLGRRPT
ncbi:MAG TPA: Hsp70 family protein, partial [Pseudonocardiaceae bacterium]|nr:Hsp70 family protein [Pseudonocardiaceae bacterium]